MWLFAFLSPILSGCALTSVLLRRNSTDFVSAVFFWSIGAGIGFGITSALAFLWLAVFGQPGPGYFLLEGCLSVLAILFVFAKITPRQKTESLYKEQYPKAGQDIPLLKNIFYLLLILAAIWFFLQSFYLYPHGKGDAYAIWNLRARLLFRGDGNWPNAFSFYPWSHPDYPLLITGSVYRAWQMFHHDTIAVPIVIAGLLTSGSVFVVFSSITILKGKNQGYLAALAILATFSYLQHGASQLADIPVAFFILATMALFAIKDQNTQNESYFSFLAGVTASCTAWTKNEGLLFMAVVMFTRFCIPWSHRSRKSYVNELVFFITGAAPILSIAFYFKFQFAPLNDVINPGTLPLLFDYLFDISRYKVILTSLIKEIIIFGDGILLAFIVYYWFSRADKNSEIVILPSVLMTGLMVCGYFAVLLLTPHDLAWHAKVFNRLLLQLWPSAVLIYFLIVAGPERSSYD